MMWALYGIAGIAALVVVVEVGARLAIALGLRTPIPPFFAGLLTSRLRTATYGPKWTHDAIGIRPGARVLEIGVGPAVLLAEAARRAGETGFAIGLDIQQPMLRSARKRLAREQAPNAALVRADAQALPFNTESLDVIYLVTVLGEFPDAARALAEVARVLRRGGMVAIVELLPDPHYRLPSTTARLLQGAGLTVEPRQGNLFAYTIRATKPD